VVFRANNPDLEKVSVRLCCDGSSKAFEIRLEAEAKYVHQAGLWNEKRDRRQRIELCSWRKF